MVKSLTMLERKGQIKEEGERSRQLDNRKEKNFSRLARTKRGTRMNGGKCY
jgi:hypothetical protein